MGRAIVLHSPGLMEHQPTSTTLLSMPFALQNTVLALAQSAVRLFLVTLTVFKSQDTALKPIGPQVTTLLLLSDWGVACSSISVELYQPTRSGGPNAIGGPHAHGCPWFMGYLVMADFYGSPRRVELNTCSHQ